MRLIVAGSRCFSDRSLLFSELDALRASYPVSCVLSGRAPGADRLGEQWAALRGIPVEHHPALWSAHGRAAGPVRNAKMAAAADAAAIFFAPGPRSPGSADMLRRARAGGLRCFVFSEQKELFP